MERLESQVKLLRPVEFGVVGNDKLWLLESSREALEVDNLGHLDLLVNSSTLVLSETRHVADGEGVRALDRNLARLTAVQCLHTFNFGKGDVVAIFKTMSSLIECRDQTLLVNASNNTAQGSLAGRVDDGELVAKVAEDGAKQAECVDYDNVDALGVAVVAHGLLYGNRGVCQHNNLVFVELREIVLDARPHY